MAQPQQLLSVVAGGGGKTYGFEGLRFHALRHTQVTLLIAQGVDIKTVQARLGHTLASTTLDLYAGVIPAKDRQAADIIDTILTAAPEQKKKPQF
jgi:integrase